MSAIQDMNYIDIKKVPQDKEVRNRIRHLAVEFACGMDKDTLPQRVELDRIGRSLLDKLGISTEYLGYAMVAVSNAFWMKKFASIPYARRLLLLPICLSNTEVCAAEQDSMNLHCLNCGSCDIGQVKSEAENLGYEVITSESSDSAIMEVLGGSADAILGVACLDSLDKSYSRISELGIPQIAVPLLKDGCVNTEAELDELTSVMQAISDEAVSGPRTYMPLLRETIRNFDRDSLLEILPSRIAECIPDEGVEVIESTESIALDWFSTGGKRLRPFLTAASYAVVRFGPDALTGEVDPDLLFPLPVKRISMAIEAMHKASLIHDDIEDDDEYRYGKRTIHKRYGIAPAINIGDYLVGLGYSLTAGESASLGAECVADILTRLSTAHLDLCRGQGGELMWKDRQDRHLQPVDALSIYALKTAPAIEVAIYAGLRAAGAHIDEEKLRQFCVYLGEGYQALNDLDDWLPGKGSHLSVGSDALAKRPTIIHAFAIEACEKEKLHTLLEVDKDAENQQAEAERLKSIYEELGAFKKTQLLVDKLRIRAENLAEEFQPAAFCDLSRFIISLILPARHDS
ncbi:MAG: polyprenyl synthetase family protein [Armatimonadota bacterium]